MPVPDHLSSQPGRDRRVVFRDLVSIDDLRGVADVERAVWAAPDEEVVPASLLVVSVQCGAHVIGAFDGEVMAGFVYSFPGRRHGRALHWSHMLAVTPAYRGAGVARRLKIAQRERVLVDGFDLIEWTFDPLQAVNAAFNLSNLGATCGEYLEDVYGPLEGPLSRGSPTDRLVARWALQQPRVSLACGAGRGPGPGAGFAPEARIVNALRQVGRWWESDDPAPLPDGADTFRLAIPGEFTAMLSEAPAAARRWREITRHVFERAFAQGFVAIDFDRDLLSGGGSYLLSRGLAPRET